jgi:type II secretory ATPase GspE/PulE/Tfp pilus assembly ATPase PilB-like protein
LGYQGRTGIHELLVVTEAIRPLVMNRASAATLGEVARKQGMRTLRQDGWVKVKAGVTTVEEVLRVTQTEEHVKSLAGDSGGVPG